MKRLVRAAATVGLMIGASVFAAASIASPNARQQDQQARNQLQQPQAPQAKTFTGTISNDGDSFVLKDDSGKSSYQLDDQQIASKFEGKRVKVTGTLDSKAKLIQVRSIEEASA